MAFILAIGVSILLYGSINYYIGLQGLKTLSILFPYANTGVYWILFWIIALSYIAARLGERFLPKLISRILTDIGAIWLGALFYLAIIISLLNIAGLVMRLSGMWNAEKQGSGLFLAVSIGVIILVTGLLTYGVYNASHPVVANYEISIPKRAGAIKELNAVMISDVHLGTIVGRRRLDKMVEMINGIKPDIVLFAGDIIDEKAEPFIEQNMEEAFKKLNPKFGCHAVLGNHEYIGKNGDKIAGLLENSGLNMLRDDFALIEGSFYIVGRNDVSSERILGHPRLSLTEIMQKVDTTIPVILLDHQPVKLDEAAKEGVDLELSGHTHKGQLFPNQLITNRIFEADWGYLKKDSLQVIVSSGFGTWGPPIRIGNKSELVNIKLRFKD